MCPVDDIPPSRIQLTYTPKTDGAQKKRELPFRQLVVGDFTMREKKDELESREKLSMKTSDDFAKVMKKSKLGLEFNVPNKVSGKPGEDIQVKLDFPDLASFGPDEIAKKVPELQKVMQMRELLVELQSKVINDKKVRRMLDDLAKNQDELQKANKELEAKGFGKALE